ncbi:hypothetical protein [Herbaspirillum sp. RV1423]|uniref:hypothetical protein n=1 Tax=Herbaspirillum sp. RV1423 TaxID=1443993 RepID=UPI0004BBD92B|nr:hypothetical protein [Herbaspirillum sp. RV1423]
MNPSVTIGHNQSLHASFATPNEPQSAYGTDTLDSMIYGRQSDRNIHASAAVLPLFATAQIPDVKIDKKFLQYAHVDMDAHAIKFLEVGLRVFRHGQRDDVMHVKDSTRNPLQADLTLRFQNPHVAHRALCAIGFAVNKQSGYVEAIKIVTAPFNEAQLHIKLSDYRDSIRTEDEQEQRAPVNLRGSRQFMDQQQRPVSPRPSTDTQKAGVGVEMQDSSGAVDNPQAASLPGANAADAQPFPRQIVMLQDGIRVAAHLPARTDGIDDVRQQEIDRVMVDMRNQAAIVLWDKSSPEQQRQAQSFVRERAAPQHLAALQEIQNIVNAHASGPENAGPSEDGSRVVFNALSAEKQQKVETAVMGGISSDKQQTVQKHLYLLRSALSLNANPEQKREAMEMAMFEASPQQLDAMAQATGATTFALLVNKLSAMPEVAVV